MSMTIEEENYYNYFKDLLVFIVENNYLNEDIQIIEEEFKEIKRIFRGK